MKTLENFIKKEQIRYSQEHVQILENGQKTIIPSCCDPYYWELERRNKWMDYFFDGIECPGHVLEASMDYGKDPILEMLNTHSIDKLLDRIKKEFPEVRYGRMNGTDDSKLNIKEESKDGFFLYDKDKEKLELIKNNDKFVNIVEFYNYYFAELKYNNHYELWVMMFEPRYSKKIKDFEKRNNGVAYHITTQENYEKIKKDGLKIKSAKYRYFPRRIYLILPNVNSSKERNDIIINTINKLEKTTSYVVLQISLHNLPNFTFYEDVMMATNKEHYIYTYQNIPTKYIKDVTYKFNKQ